MKKDKFKLVAPYGTILELSENVVPNEPFDEITQLALDIYGKALRESNLGDKDASKNRKIKSRDLKEHCHREKCGKKRKPSNSHSHV